MTAVLQKPDTDKVIPVVLPGASLRNALTACLVAAQNASEESLEVLMAVHVAKTGERLVLRSTDRYRAVIVTIKLDSPPEGDWETLISTADTRRAVTGLPKRHTRGAITAIGPTRIGGLNDDEAVDFTPVNREFPSFSNMPTAGSASVEQIALNPKFLAGFARLPGWAPNEPALLEFNGPNKPVVCNWTDYKDDNLSYRYVMWATRIRD